MRNIAIVAGGDSGEFEISMKSGRQVEDQIDRSLFNPFLIEIRGDNWRCLKGNNTLPVDKNNFSVTLDGTTILFDAVFNAIHGTPGEDGKLQGYLDMLGIPYTSSNVMVSALTFNKSFCKRVVGSLGIDTPHSVHLVSHRREHAGVMLKDIRYPCFVKPNCSGSSVGMTKAASAKDIPAALDRAFAEGIDVIVEEFVPGRELTCGVLYSSGGLITFPVCEIVTRKEFFDYEAKYTPGLTDEIVPAPVPEMVALECQRISAFLYGKLNCRGIIRIDYIHSGGTFYFLEVNTVPGLTAESIVPKMIAAHGWTYTELITRMILECL